VDSHPARPSDVARRFLAFAAAVALFHHLPALVGHRWEEWVDLVTPFAVLAAAAWVLVALAPATHAWIVAGLGGVLYTAGQGIHLAANTIRSAGTTGAVEDEAYFWDETWGHIEWHTGLFLLLAAICLADRGRRERAPFGVAALLLGLTFFTNTVEGGDWWLSLVAAAVFVPWALARRTPLRLAAAAACALTATLIGAWAVWHGGVPQFSQLGWI
jgi:hypothetical protein